MKAIIMAGGKGTRIQSIRSDIPKPMIEICGKPILLYQIENLVRSHITDITLVIGHLGSVIQDYFGDGSRFGAAITYVVEEKPLGTAGALFKMASLQDDFLLLCGDTIFDIDFERFIAFHNGHHAWATLLAHPNGHPYDSSLLQTELLPPKEAGGLPQDTHRVLTWLTKEDERLYYKNCVNAGIEIISPKLLAYIKDRFLQSGAPIPEKLDLDRDVLKPGLETKNIFAYNTSEYIKDMGTPDRYYETEKDIREGKVAQKNLSQKQRAIFLDRDGTLNKDVGFVTNQADFSLIDGAAEAVKNINESGYLAIVITNQPVIARGELDFAGLAEIHCKLETLLGKSGAYIDGLYFCPHHPDGGFAGERPAYKVHCQCRKPAPGLLLQAAADYNIDLAQSIMVGDSPRDVEAGNAAGCKHSVLLKDGYTLLDFTREFFKH